MRRVTPHTKLSRTALFIRSSARLGTWAVLAGAAANFYYHKAFTSIVVAETVKDPTPPKLWEKTEKYTVEDGCLAGAAVGLVAFLPTLLMRRASVYWWSRAVAMTNIGACVGVVASHGYFQYTGERQKALEELNRQRRRRTLEFFHIFWDKILMAKLDPPIQQYVRHNGIFRAYQLPEEVYEEPEKFGIFSTTKAEDSATDAASTETTPETGYYVVALDHADHLKNLNVDDIYRQIDDCERQKQENLKEADWMVHELSRRQEEFCHTTFTSEDEKQKHRELQLMGLTFNRLRAKADELDRSIYIGHLWIKQKKAWETNDTRSAWLTKATLSDPESHNPSLAIAEMKKFQEQFTGEIKTFEGLVRSRAKEDVPKMAKWKQDLEDARTMLRAADQLAFDMEKTVQATEKKATKAVKVDKPPDSLEPEKP